MSEDKKTEFGTKWIGETPIQRHMREEAEARQVPPWEDLPGEQQVEVNRQGDGLVWGKSQREQAEELLKPAEGEISADAVTWKDIPADKPVWFPALDKKSTFTDNIAIERGIDDLKVTGVPEGLSQEDAAQGYSWTVKMEVDPNAGKVVSSEIVGDGWGAELPPQEQTPEVQTGIPTDKLREVAVPFAATTIREYFSDKSLFFIANYSESKLKGTAFLTYLSNINIPSDVKFNTPIAYEEYAEIMKAYMEQPGVINAAGLHVMAAEMLLVAKGLPYDRSPYALPIDEEIVLKFIQEYKYLVDNWIHFIDSTQVYALRSIKVLNDHFKPEERFPVVEDASFVGWNVAQLFRIPEFIAVYFAIEGATYKQSYFRHQYEEYMFKNETLAKYFRSENNFAALYFSHFATGLFEPKDVNHGLFSTGVFDPNSEYYEATPYVASLQE